MSLKPWLDDYNENNRAKRGKVELVSCSFRIRTLKKTLETKGGARNGGRVGRLEEGARVFLQSDVKEVAEDMRDKFEKFGNGKFVVGEFTRRGDFEANGARCIGLGENTRVHCLLGIKRMVEENPLGIPRKEKYKPRTKASRVSE